MLNGHCSKDDWEIILIDKNRHKHEARQKELFLQYKLDPCALHGSGA